MIIHFESQIHPLYIYVLLPLAVSSRKESTRLSTLINKVSHPWKVLIVYRDIQENMVQCVCTGYSESWTLFLFSVLYTLAISIFKGAWLKLLKYLNSLPHDQGV